MAHNAVFPETFLKVEGFGRTDSGDFSILVRQPFILINGDLVSDEEIVESLAQICIAFGGKNPHVFFVSGFILRSDYAYYLRDGYFVGKNCYICITKKVVTKKCVVWRILSNSAQS